MAATPTTLAHDAIANLQRLTDLFQARRAALALAAGLTEQQWEVLERIATEHFMPSLFARHRASSAAAVSRLIRQLLDKRLVSVSARAHDGRQRQYVLTGALSTPCAPIDNPPSTPSGPRSTRPRSRPSSP